MRISDWSSDVCSSDLDIGWDLSVASIWRPKATQNIVGRLSAAVLLPGKGFKDLFDNQERDKAYVSILANLIVRSEEHTSELQSLMRISYAVFCLKKKKTTIKW